MTKRKIDRFMDAVSDGMIPLEEASLIAEELDPLLVYFMLRYLKEMYGKDQQGSGGRLLQLLSNYPVLAKLAVAPKNEPMLEWFNDSHTVHSFHSRDEYLNTIIDKLEG